MSLRSIHFILMTLLMTPSAHAVNHLHCHHLFQRNAPAVIASQFGSSALDTQSSEPTAYDFLPSVLASSVERVGPPIGGGMYSSAAFLKDHPNDVVIMLRLTDADKVYREGAATDYVKNMYTQGKVPLTRHYEYDVERVEKIRSAQIDDIKSDALLITPKMFHLSVEHLVSLQDFTYQNKKPFPEVKAKIVNANGLLVGYIVEYVRGKTFAQLLDGDRISKSQALRIYYRLESMIKALHSEGRYHGDPHRNNVIVDLSPNGDFEIRLLDPEKWSTRDPNDFESRKAYDFKQIKKIEYRIKWGLWPPA